MKVGLVEFRNGIIMPDGVTVSPAMNVHTISSDLASVKTALDGMQQKTSEWVEDKLTRVGNLGVEISTMKEGLDDTAKAMLEDKKFLAELEKGCATKQGVWDECCKTRTEELLALADTIKMLNDDDALELFKKTLPGASAFLQVQVSAQEVRSQALSALKTGAPTIVLTWLS